MNNKKLKNLALSSVIAGSALSTQSCVNITHDNSWTDNSTVTQITSYNCGTGVPTQITVNNQNNNSLAAFATAAQKADSTLRSNIGHQITVNNQNNNTVEEHATIAQSSASSANTAATIVNAGRASGSKNGGGIGIFFVPIPIGHDKGKECDCMPGDIREYKRLNNPMWDPNRGLKCIHNSNILVKENHRYRKENTFKGGTKTF